LSLFFRDLQKKSDRLPLEKVGGDRFFRFKNFFLIGTQVNFEPQELTLLYGEFFLSTSDSDKNSE
jgi:hypothetical protein